MTLKTLCHLIIVLFVNYTIYTQFWLLLREKLIHSQANTGVHHIYPSAKCLDGPMAQLYQNLEKLTCERKKSGTESSLYLRATKSCTSMKPTQISRESRSFTNWHSIKVAVNVAQLFESTFSRLMLLSMAHAKPSTLTLIEPDFVASNAQE